MPSCSLRELFTSHFDKLTDPRINRSKRHELLNLVILAVCATLGGANGWVDLARFARAKVTFFRQFLDLANGMRSQDTFGRVFARLGPGALRRVRQRGLSSV